MQLSGIGDPKHLQPLGVPMVNALPGVGENLQDHLEVYIQYASKLPVSIAPGLAWHRRPGIGYQWLFHRRGLGATNHFEGGGFARSNEDVDWPNLMFHFLPVAIRYDGTSPTEGHGYQVHIGPMYADTRGWVRIASTDPKQHPKMLFNYLTTANDRREWVEAVRVARDILNQNAFAPFNAGELSPGPGVETDEEILDWVREDAETALHPSCTAKMGLDEMSVTDPASMKVHGLDALRGRRRQRLPLRHERQHLRARDDGRREGRRPDPRQLSAPGGAGAVLPAPRRLTALPARRQPQPPTRGGAVMTATQSDRNATDCVVVLVSRAARGGPLEDLRSQGRQDHRHARRAALPQGAAGEDGSRPRHPRRLLRRRARRGVRGDGPVRVGQVDAGAPADPADRADRRHGRSSTARTSPRCTTRRCSRPAARRSRWCSSTSACSRTARSSTTSRSGSRSAARDVRSAATGPRRWWTSSDSRATRTTSPTSSPAGCSSGSAWRAPWRPTPTC